MSAPMPPDEKVTKALRTLADSLRAAMNIGQERLATLTGSDREVLSLMLGEVQQVLDEIDGLVASQGAPQSEG